MFCYKECMMIAHSDPPLRDPLLSPLQDMTKGFFDDLQNMVG